MLYLVSSIILTSYLTLAFKFVEKFRINTFQAIVFNYCTCVVTGSFVNGEFPVHAATFKEEWFKWALLMGAMFISILNVLGFTAQKIGVAVASVANKLSLVIPFLFSIYLYKEKVSLFRIAGIVVAVIAVILTCWPRKQKTTSQKFNPLLLILLPAVLFFSSGLLDTLIKYTEQGFLNDNNKNSYLVTTFAVAAGTGLVTLLLLVIAGRQRLSYKSIIAGIGIGIPNYFSIWCLMRVLKDHTGNSSAIIPINNMGIVLFSAVAAWILFKEKLSGINWVGIILSIGAIALIAFG
jgi:drug/metabolite transporter (DMT)-like permease